MTEPTRSRGTAADLIAGASGGATPGPRSRLAGLPSPYLAMHVDDPVDWWPWGAEAFAEARRRKVPLLVSVGFFACHWCHVQQKESFRDGAIAAQINGSFVPVKVDREIDGSLDATLQAFANQRIGRRGWPLQVLITPDGYPALAALYQPPDEFRATLAAWTQRWRDDADGLQREARALAAPAARTAARVAPDNTRAAALAQRLLADVQKNADMLEGGFGLGAKFPSAPQLLSLLALQPYTRSEQVAEFLRLTLAQMSTQGLRDHIWGGFFRYTIDPGWREPHFEKMLVDNALVAIVYLRAAGVLREPRWRAVALETLRFMRRELRDPRSGAFASGLSAQDAQGREGARHLWDAANLAATLPPGERAAVVRLWGAEAAPAFALGHLPHEARAPSPDERVLIERAYRRLRAAREGMRHPRDDKLLAAGNGFALAALSEAAAHDAQARQDAAALARFIETALWNGRGLRKLADSDSAGELDDYAAVSWGLALHAARTDSARSRRLGVSVARAAWERFYRSGWFREERPLLAGLGPAIVIADTHVPSPSALLVVASVELDDAALVASAREALSLGGYPPLGAALGWATHTWALDRLARAAGPASPASRR